MQLVVSGAGCRSMTLESWRTWLTSAQLGDIYLTPANMYEAGKEPPPSNTTTKAAYNKLVEDIYKMISERGSAS